MIAANWIPVSERMPEEGQKVDWISPGGVQVDGGQFAGGAVWFLAHGRPNSMYVYYRPAFWRPSEGSVGRELQLDDLSGPHAPPEYGGEQ